MSLSGYEYCNSSTWARSRLSLDRTKSPSPGESRRSSGSAAFMVVGRRSSHSYCRLLFRRQLERSRERESEEKLSKPVRRMWSGSREEETPRGHGGDDAYQYNKVLCTT